MSWGKLIVGSLIIGAVAGFAVVFGLRYKTPAERAKEHTEEVLRKHKELIREINRRYGRSTPE